MHAEAEWKLDLLCGDSFGRWFQGDIHHRGLCLGFALLDGVEQVHRNVLDQHFAVFDTFALDAVIDHHVTEWARRSDASSTRCKQFL